MTAPISADCAGLDIVLYPNRSLSRKGLWIVMGVLALGSTILCGAFLIHGAWPVLGFFGLDLLLLYAAFRASYRSGRMRERIFLSADDLHVIREDQKGRRQRFSFNPYWVRVHLDRRHDDDCELSLQSHGRKLVIGAFLSPEERISLGEEIRRCLHGLRHRINVPAATATAGGNDCRPLASG